MRHIHPQKLTNPNFSNLSTLDTKDQSGLFYCRVCKGTQGQNSSEDALVFVCLCSEPIHSTCFQTLVPTQLKKKNKKSESFQCKDCNTKIKFKVEEKTSCRSKSQVRDYAVEHCCSCTSIIILILIMLGLVAFIAMIKTDADLFADPITMSAAVIGLSVTLGLMFLIVAYFLVSEVFLKFETELRFVENKKLEKHGKIRSSQIQISNVE